MVDRLCFVSYGNDDADFHRTFRIKSESGVSSPHAAFQTQPFGPRRGEAFSHQPKCRALYFKYYRVRQLNKRPITLWRAGNERQAANLFRA